MVKMSGGEALVKSLVREGVDVVFGIPGIQMYGIIAASRSDRDSARGRGGARGSPAAEPRPYLADCAEPG